MLWRLLEFILTRKKTQTIDLKENKKGGFTCCNSKHKKKSGKKWEEIVALKEDPNINEYLSFIHVKS